MAADYGVAETILRGTAQMSDAARGLADATAKRTARKTATLNAISGGVQDALGSFKEHRSWLEAKREEDDVKAVSDADALGRATGDPAKALVTLQATMPRTAKGAMLRAKAMQQAQADTLDALKAKMSAAELAQLTAATEQERTDRESIRDVVQRYPIEDPVMNALALSKGVDAKSYMNFYAQRRMEKAAREEMEFKESEATRKAGAAEAAEAGRNRRFDANRAAMDQQYADTLAQRQREHGDKMTAGAEALDVARSRLNWQMSNTANANALRAYTAQTTNSIRMGMMQVGLYREQIDATVAQLRAEMERSKMDRRVLATKEWNPDDPDLPRLRAAVDDHDVTIGELVQDLEVLREKLPSMPQIAPPPTPGAAPSGAPAAAPAQAPASGERRIVNGVQWVKTPEGWKRAE